MKCTRALTFAGFHNKRVSGGNQENGFTLVELMIVVAIVAILVMLSYPSYVSFIRKSERADAQAELLDWANRQHIWRADHISYNEDINPADTESYEYSIDQNDLSATSFTLIAAAIGDQAADEEKGTDCSTLSLDETGMVRLPVDCWK